MYLSLYRKYRPKTFSDVTGQEHITETLKRQLQAGKAAHAYLFAGTRGTGKTTCARILAKAVNCENPQNGEPCNVCPNCLGIDNGSLLDVTEMDGASNNGVDDVRMLQEEANYLPGSAKKRVYIIDEVHMLSKPAFNALLKTLEEPPEYLMFILATTELNKVLPTILSRCQKFAFRRIPQPLIAERLKLVAEKENLPLTEDGARVLARLADGAMRDALSLLERCQGEASIDRASVLSQLGLADNDAIREMYGQIGGGDALGAVTLLNELYIGGKDPGSTLEQLSAFVRDSLLLTIAPREGETLLSGAFDADELAPGDAPTLMRFSEHLQTALQSLDRAPDRKTAAELALLQLIINGEPLAMSVPVVSPVQRVAPAVVRASAPVQPQPQPAGQAPQFDSVTPIQNSAEVGVHSGEAGYTWQELLKAVKFSNPVLLSLLKLDSTVTTQITPTTITLYVSDPYMEGMLSDAGSRAELAAAAKSLNGGVLPQVLVHAGRQPAGQMPQSLPTPRAAAPTAVIADDERPPFPVDEPSTLPTALSAAAADDERPPFPVDEPPTAPTAPSAAIADDERPPFPVDKPSTAPTAPSAAVADDESPPFPVDEPGNAAKHTPTNVPTKKSIADLSAKFPNIIEIVEDK
jgi:DNA polymerase-3 subunit gamma/tau